MKNRLFDLNDHLFAQMERLSEENMSAENIEAEVKRTDAIVAVSEQILNNANVQLKAATLIAQHGDRFQKNLPMLAVPAEPTALAAPAS